MTENSSISDAQLLSQTAEKISRPRQQPADSFVLHAPLELTARASLLPFVLPDARDEARCRIAELGDRFEASGPAADLPDTDASAFDDVPSAVEALVAAVGRGDLDAVDAPAAWLGDRVGPAQLTQLLGAEVLPRLGAAAHAPIFLFHLPRVSPRGELTARLLRPLVRELARMPAARMHWVDERGASRTSDDKVPGPGAISDALARLRLRGRSENNFIAPTMERIDDAETAEVFGPLVAGADVRARGHELLRAAARSMLVESTKFTPYIWTHCLTLPQAALGCAPSLDDPSLALAVAATHVIGFRSAFAAAELDGPFLTEALEPGGRAGSLDEAIESGPDEAAAFVLSTAPNQLAALAPTLATRALVHTDAHYGKYTLACLDAAADDRDATSLFLAAAAKLAGYWSANDAA